ncbi:putative endonuclease-reverse transcriptase [Operophtera brumata]|uniref:Putative endonuclease-reverse transcriptase n=1 Tax=Operophtera brumata TaxID=104452 RepID=A0A0L7L6Z7_OPEBR|nr:putative endonuclease-reverse transcriptase [Operophtera brumata]
MVTAYYVENKQQLLSSWCCPSCVSVNNPARNDETPVKKLNQSPNDTGMSVDEYVQEQVGTPNPTYTNKVSPSPNRNTEVITLDNLRQLLDTKLEEKLENHKCSIITEIRAAFKSEISKAVENLKQEITQNTDTLHREQINIKEDISNLDDKIEKLETENSKLKIELQKLHKYDDKIIETKEDNCKKIVIYGLDEYNNENESEQEKQLLYMFSDVMCTDLTGYIEEINRMGKYGRRRPILLELISKRMTKYIWNNARRFRSTGVYVTEFLAGQALEDKRKSQQKRHSMMRCDGYASTSSQIPTVAICQCRK